MDMRHPAVSEAKRLFTGALIATSIVPINSFIGRIIGSYLPHGQVASLTYAFRIFILPFSLFAVPVYTVMFSKLSRLFHEKDWKGVASHIDSSVVLLAVSLIPSTILLCSTGDICVKILYERGAFTANDTFMTNRALFGYSIGLLFYALSISFVRVFNAMHDMRTPAFVGISSIALNAVIAVILMKPLGNLGISLATSLVSLYNFLVLYIIFRKKVQYRMARKTMRDIIRSLLAGIVLVILIYSTRHFLSFNLYLTLIISAVLTLVVYGLFFRQYYSLLLKKR
jgi:putative peptidoglycan lipid II flippase